MEQHGNNKSEHQTKGMHAGGRRFMLEAGRAAGQLTVTVSSSLLINSGSFCSEQENRDSYSHNCYIIRFKLDKVTSIR